MDRKNINRGFKKFRVWQDAVSLYVSACKIFANFPFELKKIATNSIDAAHSISRNISEGYCRRSLKSKHFLKQYPLFASINFCWYVIRQLAKASGSF